MFIEAADGQHNHEHLLLGFHPLRHFSIRFRGDCDRAVVGSSLLPSDEATTGTNAGPEKLSTTEGGMMCGYLQGTVLSSEDELQKRTIVVGDDILQQFFNPRLNDM